jgi:hypothetical protein
MQRAPPRRLAKFMLRVLQAKQQQAAEKQPHEEQQEENQSQQQPAPGRSFAVTNKHRGYPQHLEGQFSGVPPLLQPLPSTLRKVHKLLARQDAAADLHALLLLCPCALSFLGQYAARASRNSEDCSALAVCSNKSSGRPDSSSTGSPAASLLQHLVWLNQHPTLRQMDRCYIYRPFLNNMWEKNVSTFRLCCQAAVAAGCVPKLLFAMHKELTEHTLCGGGGPVLLPLLLRYAARYSNAQCLEAVYLQTEPWSRGNMLAPQHLAMAASRRDPWAAGVVRLLLQLLRLKQLKPSHMRPAYKAAAVAGHLPVLALLLGHAASAPHQHMPVLLQAVADSNNSAVAELLLGDTAAALVQLQGQLEQHQDGQGRRAVVQQGRASMQAGPQQAAAEQLLQHVQQLRQGWGEMDWWPVVTVLTAVLPSLQQGMCPVVVAADTAADHMRLCMADLLLQLLPESMTAFVRDKLRGLAGWESDKARRFVKPVVVQERGAGSHPGRLCWQLQHSLLPAVWSAEEYQQQLHAARDRALRVGDLQHMRMAAVLHRQAAKQGSLVDETLTAQGQRKAAAVAAVSTAFAAFEGQLLAACAACDIAAVAQLEQLHMLCYMLLTPPACVPMASQMRPTTTAAVAPTLPVSLTGGRVVTVAHLSAGLGLPWGLLKVLLTAAEYDKLGCTVVGGAPSCTAGCSSIAEQMADAQLSVQDPAAAQQKHVLMATEQSGSGLSLTADELTWDMRQYLLQHRTAQDSIDPSHSNVLSYTNKEGYLVEQAAAFGHGLQQLLSQQEQQGPPPLWQQALLQVVAQHAAVLRSRCTAPMPAQPWERWAGLPAPLTAHASLLLHGLRAGRSVQEVQAFISSRLLQPMPSDGFQPCSKAVWGPQIMRHALLHGLPELLAWALQPERRSTLWGTAPDAVAAAMTGLPGMSASPDRHVVTPISNVRMQARSPILQQVFTRTPWQNQQQQQLQQELAQMQQQRLELLGPASSASSSSGPMVSSAGPLPIFAASAVQLALLLLQQPGIHPNTLSTWLEAGVRNDSPLPDLVRARAIVAAVAASAVIPKGAQALNRGAVKQVLQVGDPDLWTALLLWSHRVVLPADDVVLEDDG